MRAAFGGYLGEEMKDKAKTWADETPNPKELPEHKGKPKKSGPLEGLKKVKIKSDKDGDE
jgi:hypothetical protein